MKRFLLLLLAATALCASARPLMVGHRGSGYAVENTAEAFERGAEMGFDYLECDVRVTADTVYVISHDETTERVGGSLTIADSKLEDLKAEKYRQVRGGVEYSGSTICTLDEYLDICKKHNVLPVIELKRSTGINNDDFSNIPGLISLIESKGFRDKAVILTSMKKCLDYIHENYPDVGIQFLTSTYWPNHFDWCVAQGFSPDIQYEAIDADCVRRFHDAGLVVNSWTVNTLDEYLRLKGLGVDMVTTDRLPPRSLR